MQKAPDTPLTYTYTVGRFLITRYVPEVAEARKFLKELEKESTVLSLPSSPSSDGNSTHDSCSSPLLVSPPSSSSTSPSPDSPSPQPSQPDSPRVLRGRSRSPGVRRNRSRSPRVRFNKSTPRSRDRSPAFYFNRNGRFIPKIRDESPTPIYAPEDWRMSAAESVKKRIMQMKTAFKKNPQVVDILHWVCLQEYKEILNVVAYRDLRVRIRRVDKVHDGTMELGAITFSDGTRIPFKCHIVAFDTDTGSVYTRKVDGERYRQAKREEYRGVR